ncbi:50S ribosomal protein L3 [Patescibacteria group bacterium]|nr:50S ribosomal protein L3 [Patescibacteria group bacterium]
MKFILGKKQHMTQVFDSEGKVYPATVLSVGPVVVTQMKSKDIDGYSATQVGYGTRNKKHLNQAMKGHVKEHGSFEVLMEFRTGTKRHAKNDDGKADYSVGDIVDVSTFSEGEKVTISAISKGKGFQGVVKRHGFHGGPRTHGQKHSEREGGSIGATGPQRVFKGKKMPGRMGGDRITLKNVPILQIDKEHNLLVVKGSVPGRLGTLVEIHN